jgi:E3 ubiquitin-protein ligase SHPRH
VYVIVAALKAVIGDRTDALTGQSNELTKIEVKSAVDQAKKGEGHAPGLTLDLMDIRSKIKPTEEMGSVRGLISEMRALVTNLRAHSDQSHRRSIELAIVEQALGKLQIASAEQLKAIAGLER